ncbi:probable LRR receptor-like serine/threonine-protein kinase At3g47570 [Rhododendron vialii]|uniref:probable LRR receptor-like serine/threonine-protein kinase At3g47570 n=1 Tax=Rhododendron vialii TaxID=182163 RepID=UPI00265F9598|nr:probable LRR receptor-like serine/threonine-protein kinase At3g47570 [Rhododendron vialii]
MPTQIGNLRNLGKLNLSENKLSGGIPETLGSFEVLEFLSLAGNHFEGIKLHERGGNKSFQAECEALKNIRHRNLVKIITSCSSTDFKRNDFKALVFEFMENGSLDNWLYPGSLHEQQRTASWNLIQRVNIAIDVASALDYLHYHCEEAIIHRDLKPSNVLLDADFCAHIKQSTAIKLALEEQLDMLLQNIYGMGEEISTQGDIYSYGVLLLEMFIGKRPTDCMFSDNLSLSGYTKMFLPNKVLEIVDPQIILEEERHPTRNRQTITPNTNKLDVCMPSFYPSNWCFMLCCTAQ